MSVEAFIALGSNLDNPLQQLQAAIQEIAALDDVQLIKASHLYQNRAIGPEQPDFVNAVVCIQTRLSAGTLLGMLQGLEKKHQRVKTQHWGPRTLDCDILLYGSHCTVEPDLIIPHPQLKNRDFVVLPLAEIAPDLILPCQTPLKDIVQQFNRDQLIPVAV